jgi:prepilin-type processing-associated H-X9-DG protein
MAWYGMNYNLNERFKSGGIPVMPRDTEVKYPGSTVLIGESLYQANPTANKYGNYRVGGPSTWTRYDHAEGAHFSFCDGHAKRYTLPQMRAGTDSGDIRWDWH